MPCRDEYAEQESARERAYRLDMLSVAMCAFLGEVEKQNPDIDFAVKEVLTGLKDKEHPVDVSGVMKWWEAHKKEDAERIERKARAKADKEAKERKLLADLKEKYKE